MSQLTRARLPKKINDLLTIYTKITTPRDDFKEYKSENVPQGNYKIFKEGINHFPKIQHPLLKSLFEPIDSVEMLETDEIFKPEYRNRISKDVVRREDDEDEEFEDLRFSRIIPTKKTIYTSQFTSDIMKLLASYYSPRSHVPNNKRYENMFKWFLRKLHYSPLIIFLKQPARLFSEPSLQQINFPYVNLQREINDMKEENNYHITELTELDILNLAISSQMNYTKDQLKSNKLDLDIKWDELESDPLSEELQKQIDVKITNKKDIIDLKDLTFETDDVLNKLKFRKLPEIMTYDINFNQLYIITIDNESLHNDHQQLINSIQHSGLEIAAIRLDTNSPLIVNSFENMNNDPHTNMDHLLKSFGELGLTKVKTGVFNNCIYLLNK
ncbi:hypothetical protein CLIB1444_02S18228 [[Candida] jaroonii]|uniref:Uncharacterized protein n=1 Tax=[Candida] jaroonii TaxID=467808 RepID=A0ACA9Y4L8_9ASCO|nr:hypothetical protein CLIB1444_02S18228 [[Candida] jaroonii]